jgi:hypothetical protein
MSTDEPVPVIEETELDLEETSGPSPWLVLGIIGAIVAIVLGIRTARARSLAKSEAVPTEIGEVGDSAFASRSAGNGA